jgi:hypothetical protein
VAYVTRPLLDQFPRLERITVTITLPQNSVPESAGLPQNSVPESAGLPQNSVPESAGLLQNSVPESAGLPSLPSKFVWFVYDF